MRLVDTPDLITSTSSVARFAVDRYYDDKNISEPAELIVGDQELTVSDCQYKLYQMQELRVSDECLLEILFPGQTLHFRFTSVNHRNEAHQEVKRMFQIATDNRLIEEAEEVLANYEENK